MHRTDNYSGQPEAVAQAVGGAARTALAQAATPYGMSISCDGGTGEEGARGTPGRRGAVEAEGRVVRALPHPSLEDVLHEGDDAGRGGRGAVGAPAPAPRPGLVPEPRSEREEGEVLAGLRPLSQVPLVPQDHHPGDPMATGTNNNNNTNNVCDSGRRGQSLSGGDAVSLGGSEGQGAARARGRGTPTMRDPFLEVQQAEAEAGGEKTRGDWGRLVRGGSEGAGMGAEKEHVIEVRRGEGSMDRLGSLSSSLPAPTTGLGHVPR